MNTHGTPLLTIPNTRESTDPTVKMQEVIYSTQVVHRESHQVSLSLANSSNLNSTLHFDKHIVQHPHPQKSLLNHHLPLILHISHSDTKITHYCIPSNTPLNTPHRPMKQDLAMCKYIDRIPPHTFIEARQSRTVEACSCLQGSRGSHCLGGENSV